MDDAWTTQTLGNKYTFKYRMYSTRKSTPVSYWHDIPLKDSTNLYNFVCEIPMNTRAKMEVALDEHLTPMKQDVDKSGELRFYKSRIPWNYGMLPKTWEDPSHSWPEIDGLKGDGDPIDVVEISGMRCEMGRVYRVQVLGAYALIDEGEVDWKIVAKRTDFTGEIKKDCIKDIHDWFRDYKIPDGKPPGKYGLKGAFQDPTTAIRVIEIAKSLYSKRFGSLCDHQS